MMQKLEELGSKQTKSVFSGRFKDESGKRERDVLVKMKKDDGYLASFMHL